MAYKVSFWAFLTVGLGALFLQGMYAGYFEHTPMFIFVIGGAFAVCFWNLVATLYIYIKNLPR